MRIHEFLVLRLLRFLRFAERRLIERERFRQNAAAHEPHVSKSTATQK
jgi:hypothetical protein